jgi:alkylation response protein AidB-like acyl-CoA dehydrogenase
LIETMDFELTDDQKRIRDAVRDFAEAEIAPSVSRWEKEGEFPREVLAKLSDLGVMGMMVPEEYGGAGTDALSYVLAVEELARVCASTAVIVSVNNSVVCYPIWKFGSEEQKTSILRELASGAALGAYALTEPQSGSDAANQKTRAVRDGSCYVLNGAKVWITNAGEAAWYVVMAMTDPGAGTHGITAFLVSAEDRGLRVGAPEEKMGLRSSTTAAIFLEDVRISAGRRLGAEGEGFRIAMTTLDHSRIGIAAQGIGIAQAAYEASTNYARTRETFGRKLAEHEAIAFQIADMRVQIEAARVLTYWAALCSEKPGVRFSKESSMAKVYATEMANAVAARAVQIFGGYGYSKEYAVERYYRDARVTTIYEGTSEIQRLVISKNVLAGR